MVYFNQKAYTPQSKGETDQWGEVLEFGKAFPSEGLWWPYRGIPEFEKLLRTHLSNFIRAKFPLEQVSFSPVLLSPRLRPGPEKNTRDDYFAVQAKIVEEHARTFVGRVHLRRTLEGFIEKSTTWALYCAGRFGSGYNEPFRVIW